MSNHQLTARQRLFLTDLFPGEDSLFGAESLAAFSVDASRLTATPLAVVRPRNQLQIEELLRWAEWEQMPIYPRAQGTGTVGNSLPILSGVVVSMLHMNRIIDIDHKDFIAEVEPGVITADLQNAATAKGMFYPPDPASADISTIGGNVSTCAGGLRAVRYGVTRDYVLGMTVVLPGGRVLSCGGRSHKDVVGLDLTRLFAGSAGKLGIFSKLILKLLPRPAATASLLVAFTSINAAMEGVGAIFRGGILPTALEFMDHATLTALRMAGNSPLPEATQAALLIQTDGSEQGVLLELERLEKALKTTNPQTILTGRGEEETTLWNVRRSISPSAFQLKPDKMGEDIAVPRGKVAPAVEAVQTIAQRRDLLIMCFGHLGDGNIHVNIMYDASNPEELTNAKGAKEEVFRLALSMGGTISGEHGTGLTKAAFVDEQLGSAEQAAMADIKRVFDPSNIMNPGKGW